jgi:hypothetical protein
MKLFNCLFILINLILITSQDTETTAQDIKCGTTICNTIFGACVGDPPSYCLCKEQYDTFQLGTDNRACTYVRKSQLTAFLLEAFCGFGIGHFYTGTLYLAVPKLIIYLIGVGGILALRIVNMKTEDNNPTTLMLALLSCVVCCFILIWHVADAFLFALGRYKDGNGIDLLKW